MSHQLACTLLDLVRDGADIPLALINQALELTGDLDGCEGVARA